MFLLLRHTKQYKMITKRDLDEPYGVMTSHVEHVFLFLPSQ